MLNSQVIPVLNRSIISNMKLVKGKYIMKTKYFILSFLLISYACSSSKVAYLYDKKIHRDVKPAIFEINPGVDRTGRNSWTKNETAFGNELYGPISYITTWINSIDEKSINSFISTDKTPSVIKSYRILPGKHQLEFVLVATGPYQSSFSIQSQHSNFSFSNQSYYKLELKQPILITMDVHPENLYGVETIISPKNCEIKIFEFEKKNIGSSSIQINKRLKANASGEYIITAK